MALSEFEIIKQVFQQQKVDRQDVHLGIGDDAALVEVPDGYELVVATDTLIADVHFPQDMQARDIGYRSLAVNLSDLAAMGAEPAWVTMALTIPESNEVWLNAFASGLFSLAEQHRVQLIGGDLSRGKLSITIQALGILPKGKQLTRSGARVGDLIYVTGTLGDAAAGLNCWQKKDQISSWLRKQLSRPKPKIAAGIALRNLASSTIDISDGLVADLGHILSASQVGARLFLEDLPLSLALCEVFELEQARDMALSGGDDYELCFTVAVENQDRVEEALREICQIAQVGEIETDQGFALLLEGWFRVRLKRDRLSALLG